MMIISVISNFMNIFGNAILIWGVGIYVTGAAICIAVPDFLCGHGHVLAAPAMLCAARLPNVSSGTMELYPKILSIGVPSGIENGMFQFGKLAIQSTVSTLGTVAIAAQAMTNILENLNGVAAIGVGIGLMTVVGQCIGAGRDDEAVYYIKKFTGIGEVVIMISCGLVFAAGRMVTVLAAWNRKALRCVCICFTVIMVAARVDILLYSGPWHARCR